MARKTEAPRMRDSMAIAKNQIRRRPQPRKCRQQRGHLAKTQQPRHIRKCEPLLDRNALDFHQLRKRKDHHSCNGATRAALPRAPLGQSESEIAARHQLDAACANVTFMALSRKPFPQAKLNLQRLGGRHVPAMQRLCLHKCSAFMKAPIPPCSGLTLLRAQASNTLAQEAGSQWAAPSYNTPSAPGRFGPGRRASERNTIPDQP
jgi:hypothetical protein